MEIVFDIAETLARRPADGSERLGETLLPKRLALPVFCSDPLSSVAYATQEIVLVLALGRRPRSCTSPGGRRRRRAAPRDRRRVLPPDVPRLPAGRWCVRGEPGESRSGRGARGGQRAPCRLRADRRRVGGGRCRQHRVGHSRPCRRTRLLDQPRTHCTSGRHEPPGRPGVGAGFRRTHVWVCF